MPKKAERAPTKPKAPDLTAQIAAQIVPMDCACAGCAALARLYGSDPQLHLFYRRRLLQKGWAGKSREAPEERQYQKAHATWAQAGSAIGLFATPVRDQDVLGDGDGSEDVDVASDALEATS